MQYSSLGSWISPLPRVLAGYGVDGQALLGELGLEPGAARIPVQLTARAWQLAAQRSGDSTIGLQAAQLVNPASWGALGLAATCAPSLRDAIQMLARYPAFISDSIQIHLCEAQGLLRLSVVTARPDLPGLESLEYGMATGFQILRAMFPGQLQLARLDLTRPATDTAPYEAFYGCQRIVFNQPRASQYFHLRDIDQPLPFGNPQLARHQEQLIVQQLQRLKQGPNNLAALLTDEIRAQLRRGEICQHAIAESLGISSRQLQRQLKERNTCFSDLVTNIRQTEAVALLSDKNKSLTEIAHQLGFSDHSNFSRAFRRWQGLSPTEFRRAD